jgi:glyoxylase-like metal-dependent hydrolase (beta-lactamase superfamily II)/rhodanese-related sulfurtransferase
VNRYLQLLEELEVRLVKAIDTHVHADHVTGLGALRDRTRCTTVMGEQSKVDVVSMRVTDGDVIAADDIRLTALYTPGHTDDSYSFLCGDRVFTGDTLLIRGTGRTDFQNGDARAQYDSLFNKLLKLPEETLVYPAHDYKGDTVSTIREEKRYNPRLQVKSVDEYVELMASLNLPNPKMMDVAVPQNLRIGLSQAELDAQGRSFTAEQAIKAHEMESVFFVDLREAPERQRHGAIPDSLHVPYPELGKELERSGVLHELASATRKRLVFYCAYGERSAMAVQAADSAGVMDAAHLKGGIDAWKMAGGPVVSPEAEPQ